MDAWLTRLLAPKPATHGAITWWQGESAAAQLCEALYNRQIHHALIFSQGSEAMKALADALVAAGLEVEWGHEKAARHRGERTVILADTAGFPEASRLAGEMRRQAQRDAQRLQPIRRPGRPASGAAVEANDSGAAAAPVPVQQTPAAGGPVPAPENAPAAETAAVPVPEQESAPVPAQETPAAPESESIPAEATTQSESAGEEPVSPQASASTGDEPPAEASAPSAPADTAQDTTPAEAASQAPEPAAAEPEVPVAEPSTQALIAQEPPQDSAEGVSLLILVPDSLELPALAAMAAPPEGVALMPGFAGAPTEDALRDMRLSALATAVEQLICRKTSQQTRRDAQAALALMIREPLTPELAAQMTLLAGKPEGYAACLGAAVHQAHGSIPLGLSLIHI